MNQVKLECRICNNQLDNKIYRVREMYFGTREEFEYIECHACGCLQIKEYPEDISKHYPENYGSFVGKKEFNQSVFISKIRNIKLRHALNYKKSILGIILNSLIKPGFEQKLAPAKINENSSILDIGSGEGMLLLNLRGKGFKNITGSDIFIKNDIVYDQHLRILKKSLFDFNEKFDLVMLNHSLEHMPDQDKVFQKLRTLVKPGGMVIIRIPIKTDFIWELYGTDWVQIDAPRHYYLHTLKSIQIIAQRNNFKPGKPLFESGIFQFYGSEQNRKNMPLRSELSYYENPSKSMFTEKEIKQFKDKASELNKNEQGDCVCLYLTPVN